MFKIQQIHIRAQVKSLLRTGIADDALVQFRFPLSITRHLPPGFERIEADEFRYQGTMYDIVRREYAAETVTVYCLADEAETRLYARLGRQLQGEPAGKSAAPPSLDDLLRFLTAQYILPVHDIVFAEVETPHAWFQSEADVTGWKAPPLSPPPKA